MSDPFIDALHDRLAAGVRDRGAGEDGERAAALTRWWEEFVDVLGQKVGAWNERQAPRPPVNFTKRADGVVHVRHGTAEATFARDGDAVHVSTRLGTGPGREAILAMRIPSDGNVVALADGNELRSPTAAAEYVLTPVLVEAFATPRGMNVMSTTRELPSR